jgi:hypothetical protein
MPNRLAHVTYIVYSCVLSSYSRVDLSTPPHSRVHLSSSFYQGTTHILSDAGNRTRDLMSRTALPSRQLSDLSAMPCCASGFFPLSTPLGVFLPVALLFACSLLAVACVVLIAPCYGRSLVTFILCCGFETCPALVCLSMVRLLTLSSHDRHPLPLEDAKWRLSIAQGRHSF